MSFEAEDVLAPYGPDGDPATFMVAADRFLARGELRLAASALDRAFGLAPTDALVIRHRQALLDELAVVEHGLSFRYVPAGTFLMGSRQGDPDERPVHPVRTGEFWIADVPMTWAAFCDLMGWAAPPEGVPRDDPDLAEHGFGLYGVNRIRLQYCESETTAALDWHAHDPQVVFEGPAGVRQSGAELFGAPPRADASRPLLYDVKPMIAVGWEDAELLAQRMSGDRVAFALPSEAEWEKAARGGLVGKRWPWGDEPPTRDRCDLDRFGEFRLADPRAFPPNGYGLCGMCGGVWEWTSTWYDALAHHHAARGSSAAPSPAPGVEPSAAMRVLRGGSWSDCAEATTVSFRSCGAGPSWRRGGWGAANPNVGFRLVRREMR